MHSGCLCDCAHVRQIGTGVGISSVMCALRPDLCILKQMSSLCKKKELIQLYRISLGSLVFSEVTPGTDEIQNLV